jgi:hypothetical protein
MQFEDRCFLNALLTEAEDYLLRGNKAKAHEYMDKAEAFLKERGVVPKESEIKRDVEL